MDNMLADALRALIAAYRKPTKDPLLHALRFAVFALALAENDHDLAQLFRRCYKQTLVDGDEFTDAEIDLQIVEQYRAATQQH